MIVTKDFSHPGIKLLEECPFPCHLVGSRLVGKFDPRTSDYDFLIVAENLHGGLYEWLKEHGFQPSPGTYGTDSRLLSDEVWTREWPGLPSIDLIPVSPKEAAMRSEFFSRMVAAGDHKAGLLAKALKANKAWPYLWAVVGAEAEGREVK